MPPATGTEFAPFVQWLLTLGVGGILAAGIFTVYRKDIRQYTELWKMTTDQLMLVIKENTSSNTRLISMLESAERNAIRKQDIDAMIDQRTMRKADIQSIVEQHLGTRSGSP